MQLVMNIHNIKSIKDLTFSFPLEKGLYAITGENASGKSTLVTCASTVFYNAPMNEHFGKLPEDAFINFELEDTWRRWSFSHNRWNMTNSPNRMAINGFYEGSIIFGNRFKNTNFYALRELDGVSINDLEVADEFVQKNLGDILRNDPTYYSNLYSMKESAKKSYNLRGHPYFRQIDGKFISQARMSTGENLLITILHSLNLMRIKRTSRQNDGRPYIVFLDEIELALHASSLRRLVAFLKEISDEMDLAIFFSTHSLELIRDIKPQNIFYLERYMDGSISVTNPCYPAYATRNLYSDDGFGYDAVIFVEDDLAKIIVERILFEKKLLNNIRVKVLPTGGWTNTLVMAHDVVTSNLLIKGTRVIVVLDRDIQDQVSDFMKSHRECKHVSPDYLPISSLEKYLKLKLVDKVDHALYGQLDNYVFQKHPLATLLIKYKQELIKKKSKDKDADDKDGKTLYGILLNELRGMKKSREDLVEFVVKYIMETEKDVVDALADYLSQKLAEC